MAGIGFLARKKDLGKKGEHELESFDHLLAFMNREVKSYAEFENQLREEITHVDHMRQNLEALVHQFESVKKLAAEREGLVKKLFSERQKPIMQMDITKCREYLRMLQHMDNELGQTVTKIIEVLKRMIVSDAHSITMENQSHVKQVHELDKQARQMLNEVHMLWRKVKAFDSDIGEISTFINKLEHERSRTG